MSLAEEEFVRSELAVRINFRQPSPFGRNFLNSPDTLLIYGDTEEMPGDPGDPDIPGYPD